MLSLLKLSPEVILTMNPVEFCGALAVARLGELASMLGYLSQREVCIRCTPRISLYQYRESRCPGFGFGGSI